MNSRLSLIAFCRSNSSLWPRPLSPFLVTAHCPLASHDLYFFAVWQCQRRFAYAIVRRFEKVTKRDILLWCRRHRSRESELMYEWRGATGVRRACAIRNTTLSQPHRSSCLNQTRVVSPVLTG